MRLPRRKDRAACGPAPGFAGDVLAPPHDAAALGRGLQREDNKEKAMITMKGIGKRVLGALPLATAMFSMAGRPGPFGGSSSMGAAHA